MSCTTTPELPAVIGDALDALGRIIARAFHGIFSQPLTQRFRFTGIKSLPDQTTFLDEVSLQGK